MATFWWLTRGLFEAFGAVSLGYWIARLLVWASDKANEREDDDE